MSNTNWKVYRLTSPKGRVYIGCTNLDLELRFQKGRGYHHNKELFDDILMYGWNSFTKEVMMEFEVEADARQHEHQLIQEYSDGYNIYRGEKERTTGRPKTPPKPVMCVETGVVYDSIWDAHIKTGLAKNKISYCCRGIRNKTGGYHWKFV